MTDKTNEIKYVPGMYAGRAKKRMNTAEMAGQYIREWETKRLAAIKKKELAARVNNCISFSRKIGVGALEIETRGDFPVGLVYRVTEFVMVDFGDDVERRHVVFPLSSDACKMEPWRPFFNTK